MNLFYFKQFNSLSGNNLKIAILMSKKNISVKQATKILKKHKNSLAKSLKKDG